jgi:hypothetical protein
VWRCVSSLCRGLQRDETDHTIPITELERLRGSALVQGIHISDRLHNASSELGAAELSSEELSDLEESQPGSLPWSSADPAAKG